MFEGLEATMKIHHEPSPLLDAGVLLGAVVYLLVLFAAVKAYYSGWGAVLSLVGLKRGSSS